tara:strand:- start:197 stop:1003 length:807 start_codon:yes stop_codon:yes gene_type:complete
LNRFKSIEWSGPAWYKIEESSKNGFPVKVQLKYFKPIHLGHGTETELDGNKMGELLPKIYKKFPDLQKCFLGLIHSHHKMGAFLSPTDEATALEQTSRDGLFFSTVVASAKEPFDCCMTYQDQFGFPNLIEGEVSLTGPVLKVPKEWKLEADVIEEEKKKEVKISYTRNNQVSLYDGYRGYTNPNTYGQRFIQGSGGVPLAGKTKDEIISAWDTETEVSEKEQNTMQGLIDEFEEGGLTYNDFIEKVTAECPNVDPHLYMDGLAYGKI